MADQGEVRNAGLRCPCGGLLIRVWDKVTGRLVRYQCMGCSRGFIEGIKSYDDDGDVQVELIEVTSAPPARRRY